MKHSFQWLAAAALACLVACNGTGTKNDSANRPAFDKSGMDTTIRPGDDFFSYVNGTWIKNTSIPDDKSGWGSFYQIEEDNIRKLKGIVEEAMAAHAAAGSIEQKVGDYYASGMDTLAREKRGAEPLKPMLDKIAAAKNYNDVISVLVELAPYSEAPLLGMSVGADEKNSSRNILILSQSGLSLPEKGYYTRTDSASAASRSALVAYARKLFMLSGTDSVTAAAKASQLLALETALSQAHRTPEELRDVHANYNKMNLAALEKLSPNMGWGKFLASLKINADSINVQQPGYYAALSSLLASQPIEAWKTKLAFDYIDQNEAVLSKAFADARFEFSRVFSGMKKQNDTWKKMIRRVDHDLGELLGQLYVKKYFTPEARQRMNELVNNLQVAFEARIKKLDWMSDSTKQKATDKLHAFLKKIGYPEKWKNYDDVTISRDHFYENNQSTRLHDFREMVGKVGKPVDRTEWGLTTPTVNAYYNPTNNEIVFPAGILQYPFFNLGADDAINYGAVGMVIGHEMTHGFDDQGREYDAAGNMQNWWQKEDAEKFKAKTAGVVKQYNGFILLDSLHVNGALTLGENLADIGGLAIAYDAFKMTKQGQDNEKIDGFTPDQRFFLGFAQAWREKYRDELERTLLNSDPHSPDKFRVNGPVSNFGPFYEAFGVKPGDKLYLEPASRASIW